MAALAFSGFSEYRESDRWKEAQGWRQYDVQHMEAEKDWRAVDVEWMEQQRRRLILEHDWREMDMHQRWLDNLRREVDEKVQQLSTLSNLSALLAGFAIVALVELSIPDTEPWEVVLLLACCTAVVVTATVLSMVTAAFVMVGLLKKYRGLKPLQEASAMQGDFQSFDEFWSANCQREYRRSLLLFTFAVPFFLANLCVISFIKFRMWGLYVGIVTSSIVGVGFLVWIKTNLTWVHFLTTEDAIDEYGLQPGSPGTVSDFHRQNSPRRAPGSPAARDVMRANSTMGANPAALENAVSHQSRPPELLPSIASVDARPVGDGMTGVPPYGTHYGAPASQGGCCGGRSRQPHASSHWSPPPQSAHYTPQTQQHAADDQPVAAAGSSTNDQGGAPKPHLP